MSMPTRSLSRRVIELACRAPSVHNTQPWQWRIGEDSSIELYADRRRQLRFADPSGRDLALSCGAAVHHSIVAARALGLVPDVSLLPSPSDGDLFAQIQLAPGHVTPDALGALDALEHRCTDRRRFTSWPVPEARLAHLAQVGAGWGAHVLPITDVTARFRTERLVGQAMDLQADDWRFAEEQSTWTNHSPVDGVPIGNASAGSTGGSSIRPHRYASDAGPEAERDLIESSDGLLAVCTAGDDQLEWLRAGESLSALWLRATADGLSIVPLSQVIEMDVTRHAMHREILGMARPQVLVRVGWQESSRESLTPTPRRPVDEVLVP
jgi:hypothetical protein